MARRLALVALVLAVAHTTVARADGDMGGEDLLTGVDGSDQGDGLPNVEPDLTVETPAAQLPVPQYGIWDRLAECESNSRWHINTGNTYYGGLQEDLVFWRRHGGLRYASRPDLASREQQIDVAQRGLAVQGWAAWPACSRRLGLR
jgi:hypothetical protein